MKTLLLLLLLILITPVSQAQVRLAAFAIGSAVEVGNRDVRLSGTLALPVVGITSTGSYSLDAGFWFGGTASMPTPIETHPATGLPDQIELDGNYPNPFNPQTTIRYGLPHTGPVRLIVYDALGREVAVLVDRTQTSGRYEVRFEAGDRPSGAYFYRLEAGAIIKAGTMLLVK